MTEWKFCNRTKTDGLYTFLCFSDELLLLFSISNSSPSGVFTGIADYACQLILTRL